MVSFEQAKHLKKLGCTIGIGKYYDEYGSIVTGYDTLINDRHIPITRIHDALQWFRDEKGIPCGILPYTDDEYPNQVFYYGVWYNPDNIMGEVYDSAECKTYPEAESALLDALIKYEEEKL